MVKYRYLVIALAFLLIVAAGCNGDEATPEPLPTTPPQTTSAPQPTSPPETFGGGGLDYTLSPNFGSENLAAGFLPDPYTVDLVSGGSVDVSSLDLGSGCRGHATSAPDFRIQRSGTSGRLRIFFVSDEGEDTTLIVNTANGGWLCNDDHSGWNPMVEIQNPPEGQYDIWVGSYLSGEFVSGTLYVTELEYDPDDYSGDGNDGGDTGGTGATLDYILSPNFGSENLEAGFIPDPYTVDLVSGGSVDVSSLDLGSGCRGHATSAPDFRIQWSGTASRLRIFFVSDEGDDTTLIVNTATAGWLCNDDCSGWNPMVEIQNPAAGQYDVWVGSYLSSEFVSGTLYITELDYDPGNLP